VLLNSKVTDGCVWRWVRLCVVSGWHWPPPPKSGLTEKVTEQRWLFSANDSMTTQFHAGCHRVPGILHTENILSRYNVNHSANVPQLLVAHCCVKVPRTAPYRRGGGVVLISHDTVDGNAIKSAAISGGFRGGRAGSAHPPPPRRTDAVTPDMWQRYCIITTPSPVYLFKHIKHGSQNIQNDRHQDVAFWQL